MCPSPGLLVSEGSFGYYSVSRLKNNHVQSVEDCVAEEVPVAMIYNGISHAVMLASPDDLEDFILGFSLSEGIINEPRELFGVEIAIRANGIEVHAEISSERFLQLKDRRRSMAGRTGCGLCGTESLEHALRLPEYVAEAQFEFNEESIHKALLEIKNLQTLQKLTGATHASAWVDKEGAIKVLKEDVGRHNALDKLIGAIARMDSRGTGFVITTSRASYEMVQKVIVAGIPMLVAISAPTGLAIRIARLYGIILIGFARADQFVIYSGEDRVL